MSHDQPASDYDWPTYLGVDARDSTPPRGLDHWRRPEVGDTGTEPVGRYPATAGGTVMLDVVAAVDYLDRGLRPGFGMWDALEEAVRWWVADHHQRTDGAADPAEPRWNEPDPLRRTLLALEVVLGDLEGKDQAVAVGDVLDQALAHWVGVMAQAYNRGYTWPHPQARRGFPPPLAVRS